ncbi:MAG: DUF1223 domain-containing protein [Phenylobacterium sp.]|uniref:DUF1223 domain-containing protein n=1 Tax=Phenylobacterium sp. TaxID=1871053 RepID=UPI00391B3688
MRKAALFSLVLALAPALASARPPVVVELFTAQGCASCSEANSNLAALAERPGVLVLTFPVDYWDYLGWTDTFAQPEFAERQKAYVTRLDLREPYTPQVVVDGHAQTGGRDMEAVERLVAEAAKTRMDPPDMAFIGPRRVDVGYGRAPRGGAEVWLIRYDPRVQEVTVRKGDNRGRTVEHRNVVRQISKLGVWRGRPTAYRMPPPEEEGLVTAVIVQAPQSGAVLALAQKDLPEE